jgi:hypothetical protein
LATLHYSLAAYIECESVVLNGVLHLCNLLIQLLLCAALQASTACLEVYRTAAVQQSKQTVAQQDGKRSKQNGY